MTRKMLAYLLVIAVAAVGVMLVAGQTVGAPKPKTYVMDRQVDLTDQQVLQKLSEGWMLGGVYQDCGAGAGEITLTGDVNRALLPFYKELAERNKKEILSVLQKAFSAQKASDILSKIIAGKDKLTNYGDNPENQALQGEYDRLQRVIAEIEGSQSPAGIAKIDDLVATLEKFAQGGTVSDINAAKKAIMAIQKVIEKSPDMLISSDSSVTENADKLERLRKAVNDSLARIQQLGDKGCRTTYVFYRQKI